ncbi:MAG: hypothetical protein RMY34_36445 [Aulosira sp. DedQUE10]|nr:hypothetical protein [Aulosira sp. DedQUE10]
MTSDVLHFFQESHRQDLETITQILANITNRNPEEIKPYLDIILTQLVEPQKEQSVDANATTEERTVAFQAWVESHRNLNFPTLSDEAISREGIYGERC